MAGSDEQLREVLDGYGKFLSNVAPIIQGG
jgi:hypothetical protein